jgi:hypothetical protein
MPTNAQLVAAQLEAVDPEVHDWFESSDTVAQYLRSGTKNHQISPFNTTDLFGQAGLQGFRIVIKKYRGGDYRAINLDGGDFGSGSNMAFAYMTIGYFATALVMQFSQLQMDGMATSGQAVVKYFQDQLSGMLKEMQWYDDAGCFGDGTGVIAAGSGSGSPSGTNPTYNLEPNFGPSRLRVNQPVGVWDTTLATYKNSGTVRVASFDTVAKTVTLTGIVTSPANTDKFTFDGLSGSAPLSGGSYRNGIYTFQNSSSSGSTLGLTRSSNPEVITPYVNAAGPLVPAHAMLLQDTLIQRRDEDAYRDVFGFLHQAQRAQIVSNGLAITDWMRTKSDETLIDLLPKNIKADDTVTLAGVVHQTAKKADRSRVDWLNKKMFGYVQLDKVKFHQDMDGRRLFETRSSTGTVTAGWQAMLRQQDNLYSADPGSGGMIYGLTLPTGY